MKQEGYYQVAGHVFKLSLPHSDKLLAALQRQYDPFETECRDTSPLFDLKYTPLLPEGKLDCIYDEPTEKGESVIKMYRCAEGWIFETAPDKDQPICATVKADTCFASAEIFLHTHNLASAAFAINNATMLLFAFASAGTNTLEMHASVIENGGKGYLFLGKSGTGKSTHSRLWLENIEGSILMNDDNPVVRIMDGKVMVFGSPWSGKTPCYKNLSAPVEAFVQIRQRPYNEIKKMSILEAYSSILSSVSGIKDDDSKMADGLNDTIDKVLSSTPCYVLDCLPEASAALLCASTIRL